MKVVSFFALVAIVPACGGSVERSAESRPGATPDPANDGAAPKACTALGTTPKSIEEVHGTAPVSIAIDGHSLYFGLRTLRHDGPVKNAGIWKVAAGGGTPVRVVDDTRYVGGPIGVLGDDLFFLHGVLEPASRGHESGLRLEPASDGFRYRYPSVAKVNVASGETTLLTNPVTTDSVDSLLVHESGVYWGARSRDAATPRVIVRHDATDDTVLASIPNDSDVVTDGADIFYYRVKGDESVLEAVSTSGGSVRVVAIASEGRTRAYSVLGVDSSEIFVGSSELDEGGASDGGVIEAIEKRSGSVRVVTRGWRAFSATVVDATHLYWADGNDPSRVLRAAKAGGKPEVFPTFAMRGGVAFIAVDACNVYWTTGAGIFGRSK